MAAAEPKAAVDTAAEDRAFRQVLGQFATGVTVITTAGDGKPVGVTANSFSSLSLQPRLILWSIRKESTNIAFFRAASHFAINVLASDQVGISQHFARSQSDKFDAVAWHPGIGGSPVLDGALATLECAAHATHDGGDHVIFVGRVLDFAMNQGKPLAFAQGRYGLISELPIVQEKPAAGGAGSVVDFPDGPTLFSLLNRAQALLGERFAVLRLDERISFAHSRILSVLDRHPDYDFDQLLTATFMGRRDLEDALKALTELGLLAQASGQRHRLTEAGQERRRRIGRRWLQFQAEQLADIPQADVEAARRVLARLVERADGDAPGQSNGQKSRTEP